MQLDLAIGQERLAIIVALSRTALGDILREFVAAGTVELDYGRVRILDREALTALLPT
jgi:hypothetical protein